MGTTHASEKNSNWKGGRTLASTGYYLVKLRGHPMADVRGYVYEHRLVASQMLGRLLRKGEIVHHRNGDKTDNRPENLEVTESVALHRLLHRRPGSTARLPSEPNPEVLCECGCGSSFQRFDNAGRRRRFISGHNMNKCDPSG